ncbi:MAG: hypothetical protein JW724_02905 [Candidatus Altiarchaeota archaeon]|nr:hypothetical protein [Candidatus Altiarchaeota archaeon]
MEKRCRSLADLNKDANREWYAEFRTGSPQNSLSKFDGDYLAELHKPRKRSIPALRFLFAVAVIYFAWVLFHEFLHYFFCTLPGDKASMMSLLPTPEIICDPMHARTVSDAFMFSMSPYIAALMALVFLSNARNRLIRLIPYTAFFDLQYNLLVTSVLGGTFGERKNDVVCLIDQLNLAHPQYGMYRQIFTMSAYLLALLAVLVFYSGYRKDYTRSRDRRFYMCVSAFYILFYAASLASLYFPEFL